VYKLKAILAFTFVFLLGEGIALAQDEDESGSMDEGDFGTNAEEPPISVSGYFRAQAGLFTPLISDGFKPQKDKAYRVTRDMYDALIVDKESSCDPIQITNQSCKPFNHGNDAGALSMARSVILLEGEWRANEKTRLRAILRGVRSLKLNEDEWAASLPKPALNPEARRGYAEDWAQANVYNEFDLREFFLDTMPFEWLSLRVGRQQISWGEAGQYRLLDVINPLNEAWHAGVLESFEDTRIPLWMARATIDFSSIDQSLELIWAPLFLDRPEDTVSTSLGWVGAWGIPVTNTPTSYTTDERVFRFPGGRPKDMRGGARWKGDLSSNLSFSLAYFYTHQISPPIPMFYDQYPGDPNHLKRAVLEFPRQHVVGFSLEYVLESPIGLVARLEAAYEPDRSFPGRSDKFYEDPKKVPNRFVFEAEKKQAVSYAVVLQRPTMIRFLNPTQNFILIAQFMHTYLPNLSKKDKERWLNIPAFNDNTLESHEMRAVIAITTNYMNGFIAPKLVGVYSLPDSEGDMGGLYTFDVTFRFGEYWRMKVAVTDFFGSDPYKGIGLFRDKDEVNLSLTCLF